MLGAYACMCISGANACMYGWYVDVYMRTPSLYKLCFRVEMLIHTCTIYFDVCIIIHECAYLLHCLTNVSLKKENASACGNAFILSLLDCIYNNFLSLYVCMV